MGGLSLAEPDRPRAARRSIRLTFAVMVAVPALCLVLLWLLALNAMPGAGLAGRFSSRNHAELLSSALLAGAGLVIVLAAAILLGSFGRRLSRDICDLAATAQHLADLQAPQSAERLSGGPHDARADSAPRLRTRTAEVAEAAAAIASLQRTATAAAASEASLRDGLRQVFVSLARRNQSLLRRQLLLIDALEQKASDPAALADLFSLDHLTTRMRRHAESLGVLSGAAPGRSWREPVQVIDVIRGAMAEVEDYKRVTVLTAAQDAVTGPAVSDMIHLLAELIENATLFSPSGTRVEVRAGLVAHGFAVEIDDRGLGMEPDQLNEINRQLVTPPDFDLADADRLGMFVAGKLAARHGVRVSLRTSPYGGTTAIVLMPASIIVPAAETGAGPQPDAQQAAGRPAGLNLQGAEARALTGRRSAPPPGPGQNVTVLNGLPAAAQPPGGTYNGLPRRARQASLSRHLRDSPPAGASPQAAGNGPAAAGPRPPEQARDLAVSLQSGWRRGRAAELPEGQDAADIRPAGQADAGPPPSEEK